jgi:hypothetical protein
MTVNPQSRVNSEERWLKLKRRFTKVVTDFLCNTL